MNQAILRVQILVGELHEAVNALHVLDHRTEPVTNEPISDQHPVIPDIQERNALVDARLNELEKLVGSHDKPEVFNEYQVYNNMHALVNDVVAATNRLHKLEEDLAKYEKCNEDREKYNAEVEKFNAEVEEAEQEYRDEVNDALARLQDQLDAQSRSHPKTGVIISAFERRMDKIVNKLESRVVKIVNRLESRLESRMDTLDTNHAETTKVLSTRIDQAVQRTVVAEVELVTRLNDQCERLNQAADYRGELTSRLDTVDKHLVGLIERVSELENIS